MPKVSERQNIIAVLQNSISLHEKRLEMIKRFWVKEANPMDNDMYYSYFLFLFNIKQKLAFVETNRYLTNIRNPVLRRTGDYITDILGIKDPRRFLVHARMSRTAFDALIEKIKDLPPYNPPDVRKPQTDIKLQVLCVLLRLGTFGNGASIAHIAYRCNVSEGSIIAFTRRFFDAIMMIESEYIFWPNEQQKAIIMKANGKRRGFNKCIGFMDGTHCILEYRPAIRGDEYCNRKGRYSIQTMAICDHQKKFRCLETGYFGRRHDARVYSLSHFGRNPQEFFRDGQMILADSAYPLSHHVITPFKKVNGTLTKRNRKFNFFHSTLRVTIENCFGLFKMRWQSLRGLRICIKEQKDIVDIEMWIRTCAVLHNFLLDQPTD
jgi:hypothetical protein